MANLMPIGRFSRSCRLSVKALRHYDAEGLLHPAFVDPDTGYRYYDTAQARTAVTISMLRSLDVPIAVIRQVLASPPQGVADLLGRERDRLQRELDRRRMALSMIDRLVRAGDVLPYDVKTRVEPERTMLRMAVETRAERHVDDSFRLVQRLFAQLEAFGVPLREPIMGRTRFHDDDAPFTVEIMVPFAGQRSPIPDASVEVLPGGPSAWTLHVGAYEELGLAHHALFAWTQKHGHVGSLPSVVGRRPQSRSLAVAEILEIYVDDPQTTNPDDLRTEVIMMI